ncbi:transposable element Tcb2 transposase [Trichonephila clavipes]|nr:transposable element Tcb2 transposase [Trichonephila clavipes]
MLMKRRVSPSQIGPVFFFMDGNEKPHRAHPLDEFRESEDIRRMNWPTRSPDLIPVEHAYDALWRAITTRNPLRVPSKD